MTEARQQLSDEQIDAVNESLPSNPTDWSDMLWTRRFARAIIAADRALAGVEATEGQQWISVETRLPAPNVDCLVYFDGLVGIAGRRVPYRGDRLWNGHGGSHNAVTHWIPLPAPPSIAAGVAGEAGK